MQRTNVCGLLLISTFSIIMLTKVLSRFSFEGGVNLVCPISFPPQSRGGDLHIQLALEYPYMLHQN
jgi:hypothetical protein